MRIIVPGLQLRNNTYHFRRAVPPDLIEIVGQREWKKTLGLGPDQTLRAHVEANRLWRETDEQIATLRRELAHDCSPAVLAKRAAEWAGRFQLLDGQPGAIRETVWTDRGEDELDSQRDLNIERIIEEAGRQSGWDEKGHPKQLTPVQKARLAVLVAGKPVEPELTVSQARDLYLSERYDGRQDKATVQATNQFIEMVGDVELASISRPMVNRWLRSLVTDRGQSAGTVRRRLTTLKAIFNYLRKNYDLKADNPFAEQDIPATAAPPKPRVPFHRRHFSLLDAYVRRQDTDPNTRHILTLLKYTGCRPMEIGGLSKSEVYLDQEVPAIRVRWTADRRLKTAMAERVVPLIGPAITAAREALSTASDQHLFPQLYRDTERLSQTLNKAIRAAGVPHAPDRLVAYSFRHSMKEAMRLAEVPEETQDAIMGHSRKNVGAGYGAAKRPLGVLKDALERSIPHLGDVDETEYLPDELP
ncbi:DUF6538 domain-containing protein [uncultured Maricaulis sp.]|uniref:DUF6538 domain-containing protein n=1 Tax=uncultured Maricaulis sp. TaxID=174710 RepID=UPI0030D7B06A